MIGGMGGPEGAMGIVHSSSHTHTLPVQPCAHMTYIHMHDDNFLKKMATSMSHKSMEF